MTVATGGKHGAMRMLWGVPVLFDELQVEMNIIILDKISFDIIIDRLTLNSLEEVLDFKAEEVRMEYRG